ncbi:MAG: hypothetical protein ACUVUP_01495 [Thermaceae bacterium]
MNPIHPLTVQMVLFGFDAQEGLLTQLGFVKRPHPKGIGSSLYQRDDALLHSTGLWVEGVYYLRPKERFFRCPYLPLPPEWPQEAEPMTFAQGLEQIRPFVLRYEQQVQALTGEDRTRWLRQLPPNAKRALRAWRDWVRQPKP